MSQEVFYMVQGAGGWEECAHGSSRAEDKQTCPDCFQCQGCSEERCRVCRKHGHSGAPTLSTRFTYGEYLKWKEHRQKASVAGRFST